MVDNWRWLRRTLCPTHLPQSWGHPWGESQTPLANCRSHNTGLTKTGRSPLQKSPWSSGRWQSPSRHWTGPELTEGRGNQRRPGGNQAAPRTVCRPHSPFSISLENLSYGTLIIFLVFISVILVHAHRTTTPIKTQSNCVMPRNSSRCPGTATPAPSPQALASTDKVSR